MDIMEFFESIQPVLEDWTKMSEYIKNEMAELLQKMGDVHYRAAISALEDRRKSNNPDVQTGMALNSLYEAYQFFYETAADDSVTTTTKNILGSYMTYGFKMPPKVHAAMRACETAVLIAMCYRELKEPALVEERLNNARECFDLYEASKIKAKKFSGFNPLGIVIQRMLSRKGELEKALAEERKQLMLTCQSLN